jgi:MtfA peptidase
VFDFFRRRRDRFHQTPLTPEEQAIIDANVPYAAKLSAEDRDELFGLVRLFLDEKHFEGCGGLELTDEMRMTIAAQACILMLHREGEVYPDLTTILVYPEAFRAQTMRREGYIVTEGEQGRLGESSTRGVVVLAWDHIHRATHQTPRGHNVVLHELAHQLDAEDGAMDGAPDLGSRNRYKEWAGVLGEAYAELTQTLEAGGSSVIDAYGATSPVEFFAVVTEVFFERPKVLREQYPALYEQLVGFYRQDPADPRGEASAAVAGKA